MKKIGEGYYYKVYDIGNGRVLKKQKNKIQIFLFIFFANRLNVKNSVREYIGVINSIPTIRAMYTKIFSTGIRKSLLGNPTLLTGINYEQDKAVSTSCVPFSRLTNDAVILIKSLWEYGIHESVYNFTINTGYCNDTLILLDFNEVSFTIEDAEKDIKNKVWLQRYSYKQLDDNKKIEYANIMEKEITEDVLKNCWAVKVSKTM